jgi:hypothetical protein
VEEDIDMNHLEEDEHAGMKKNLVSLTRKLKDINREMHKNVMSGKKDFNKKTPEFMKALENAQ